jgi:hypothetical protein
MFHFSYLSLGVFYKLYKGNNFFFWEHRLVDLLILSDTIVTFSDTISSFTAFLDQIVHPFMLKKYAKCRVNKFFIFVQKSPKSVLYYNIIPPFFSELLKSLPITYVAYLLTWLLM